MKKLIIVLGIAVSMYLASKPDSNPPTYRQYYESIKPQTEEVNVNEISGEVLVSDLTASQLRTLIKETISQCKTTSMYAYASASGGKWGGKLLDDSDFGIRDSEHYITCE